MAMTDDMEPQRLRETACPACGSPTPGEADVRHSLTAMGYLHNDQTFECPECGHGYSHGVPVGDYDRDADDLWCDVCNLGFMSVHRTEVQLGGDGVRLHLKCGHHHRFQCPTCETSIPPDGVTPTRDGGYTCPWCNDGIARDDVPFCYYFTYAHRSADSEGRSLVGYPALTGRTDGAQEYGY